MHKVLTVLGARPQFIKAAPISAALAPCVQEILVHTGQHYDANMSDVFFDELNLPEPHYHLGVGGGSPSEQLAHSLLGLVSIIEQEQPHAIVVYGDTTSTLAGALSASQNQIPLIHIEAGLRSFDRKMPEEVNRVMTDQLAQLLCVPTESAMQQLKHEGLDKNAVWTGDVMADMVLTWSEHLKLPQDLLQAHACQEKSYALMTLHRAELTSEQSSMANVLTAIQHYPHKILFPVHPRTKHVLQGWEMWEDLCQNEKFAVLEPLSYGDFLALLKYSEVFLTDSGGAQKEAALLKVPCITMRHQTEWLETLESGCNTLVGYDPERIKAAIDLSGEMMDIKPYYKAGDAVQQTVTAIQLFLDRLKHLN